MGGCVCLPSGERKVKVVVAGHKDAAGVLGGLDLDQLKEALQGRGNIVMTRVNDEDLGRIDALVQAGLFDSRSAATAFLIQQGITAQSAMFEKIHETAKKIHDLREKMKKELSS